MTSRFSVGSLFTGVGGFDLGAEQAGAQIDWAVEIDPQARAVLRHRFPNTTIYEDVCDVGKSTLTPTTAIIGGFPCQDLSVAGKRKGMAGERSGLWWEFHRIIGECKPRWVVVENVPGLLSSNEGRDMLQLVESLEELGYGWAYRIFDSQYFGVAQRRRRVFIVGYLGAPCPPEILLECESVQRDSEAGGRSGQGASQGIRNSAEGGGVSWYERHDQDGRVTDLTGKATQTIGANADNGCDLPLVLKADGYSKYQKSKVSGTLRAVQDKGTDVDLVLMRADGFSKYSEDDVTSPIKAIGQQVADANLVLASGQANAELTKGISPTLNVNRDGSPIVFTGDLTKGDTQKNRIYGADGVAPTLSGAEGRGDGAPRVLTDAYHDVAPTLASSGAGTSRVGGRGAEPEFYVGSTPPLASSGAGTSYAFNGDQSAKTRSMGEGAEQSPTLRAGGTVHVGSIQCVPRRLTPRECERLQGFPDDWTRFKDDGTEVADGPRYRMMGNAVTVNVSRWIFNRIIEYDKHN